MTRFLLKGCICMGLMACLAGCDTGTLNDLECDETYEPECIDATHFMSCFNSTLIVTACGKHAYCTEGGVSLDASGSPVITQVHCALANGSEPVETPIENEGLACTNGDLKCDGASVMICQYGTWTLQRPCAGGCANGACKPSPGYVLCTDGETTCDANGKKLKTCVGGEWVFSTCVNGCANGSCLTASAPE